MSSDPRHHLGRAGEELAARHLERLGYDVLERNYRTRWGELDIIAYDGATLAFVEVKSRRLRHGGGGEPPVAAITAAKQLRVRRMAARWLCDRRERPRAAELRFDAIGVSFDGGGRLLALDHLEGVF